MATWQAAGVVLRQFLTTKENVQITFNDRLKSSLGSNYMAFYYEKSRMMANKLITSGITVRRSLRSEKAVAHLNNIFVKKQLDDINVFSARPFTSKSLYLMAKTVVNVPSMGDSITEGTIASWTVEVGSKVKEGDVVALIETDKVTVDIKAPLDGIISAQYGKSDDVVTVGKKLYEIDVDISMINTNDISEKDAINAVPVTHTINQLRVPSIKFLGKNGWSSRKNVTSTVHSSTTAPVVSPPSIVPTPSTSKSHRAITVGGGETIRFTFGRGRISNQEMESLLMGGASTAPNIFQNGKKKRE